MNKSILDFDTSTGSVISRSISASTLNVNIYQFHEMVTKADKHGFDHIKTQTLNQFVNVMIESDSPSVARLALGIPLDDSEEEDKWDDDPKHSFNGFWNKNCFVHLTKLSKPLPDSIVTHCYDCNLLFSMIQRKHHCRACGKIFCSKCSKYQIIVPQEFQSYIGTSVLHQYLSSGQERVCHKCFLQIQDYYKLEQYIQFLKIGSFNIQILWRLTKINSSWKKAVLFYLSILRENLFKYTKDPLKDYEKRFLIVNSSLLQYHSCWTLILLKLDKPIAFDTPPSTCCAYTICSSICRNRLSLTGMGVLECLKVLDGGYSDEIVHQILLYIREFNIEELHMILPFLVTICDEKGLLLILQPHTKKIYPIFSLVYWLFTIFQQGSKRRRYDQLKDYLILLDPSFSSQYITINSLLATLEEHTLVDHLKFYLPKLSFPLPSLFHPTKKIVSIDASSIKSKESASAPTFVSYELNDGNKESFLYKREDIRKDLYSIMILRLFIYILRQHHIEIPFITYQIIPISIQNGLIEIVKNAKTLHDIILEGSLNNYLQNSIHHDLSLKQLSDNFIQSFAFWTVASYLLGLGDRHLENIMVSDEGILFHIDFGFILGKDVKPYAPLVRVDTFMIEGIGGTTKLVSFKNLCTKMFLILRKYVFLFTPCYHLFLKADPPIHGLHISSSYLTDFITSRYLVGQSDEDAQKYLEYIIDSSKDAFSQKISDYIHSYKPVATVTNSSKSLFQWFGYK